MASAQINAASSFPSHKAKRGNGAPPAEIDVTVRQLSLAAGWGLPATRRLSLS